MAVTAGINLQDAGQVVTTNIAMQEPDIVVIGRRPAETSLLDDLVNGVGGFINDLLSIRVSIGQSSFRVDAGGNNIVNATTNGLSVLNGSLVANRNGVALRTNFVRAGASSRSAYVGAGRFAAATTTSGDALVRAGNSSLAIVDGGVVVRLGSAGLARSSDGSVTRITLPGARALQGNGFTRVTVGGVSLTRANGFIGLQAAEGVSSPSALARAFQGKGAYLGVDTFRDITLKEGTVIYAGEPGASGFFTTSGAIVRTGNDAQAIFEGLQVSPRDGLYRPGVTRFVVTKDTPAAFGVVRQNPQFGSGGLPQIYIDNFSEVTRPTVGYPLTNRTSRLP